MRLAICDDDLIYTDYILHLLEQKCAEWKIPYSIDIFPSAESMLFQLGDTVPYHVLFLDIQMGKMNGMDLAKKIREKDNSVFIVFITGVKEYALAGYEVGAFRYLLKPIQEKAFHLLLDDIYKRFQYTEQQVIILENKTEFVKFAYHDILFVEAFGHYCLIQSIKGNYEIKINFTELFKRLNDERFIITHRSYFVNIEHIERIQPEECLLYQQYKIPISRMKYRELNEAFIRYFRRINDD